MFEIHEHVRRLFAERTRRGRPGRDIGLLVALVDDAVCHTLGRRRWEVDIDRHAGAGHERGRRGVRRFGRDAR